MSCFSRPMQERVNEEAVNPSVTQMAHRILHDHEGDGRSVLGMLEVQVERDPKTGVTVVRSVTPVSAPAGAPKATPIFDDGRKSIHTVGGTPGQPTSEELRQVLSVADGFGMKVLLDEVAALPHEAEMKSLDVESSRVQVETVLSMSAEAAPLKETHSQINIDRKSHVEAKQKEARNVRYEDNQTATVVIDNEIKLNSQSLEENPVTLLFLGYADDTEDVSQDDQEGMITVERVMITEDGEETLLGHETSASLQPASEQEVDQEGDTETPVQTLPVQTPPVQNPPVQNPPVQSPPVQTPLVQNPPDAAEDETGAGIKPPPEEEKEDCKGKQKTCKCCSVM
ncbi:hypothetical protein FQA47_018000 [Oryzias melastigma]|uniref:Paralemmin n=1 Tax=Oryzias melastigma TaxID=30732 RepID=A0A834F752_ORYME|nr:hypothetical protein FQA47_018000 [Oryzias melastigma]